MPLSPLLGLFLSACMSGSGPAASLSPPEVTYSTELSQQLRAAFEAKGPDYIARTHHKDNAGRPIYINRLILETSPYLLQHAHNPVNWRPWGEAAFVEAASLDKPVLLSVGYSTCHWCHVMERESFEDLEIAAFINQHFIAIKVDREERPDVDEVYMAAVHLMTGRGGWPMTVVMTPDKEPFFGGTYFPARDGDRGASMGFLTLLQRLTSAYEDQRDRVVADATEVSKRMRQQGQMGPSGATPGTRALLSFVEAQAERYDHRLGGFGKAPKFPRPAVYSALLRMARRTGDPKTLEMVRHSLTQMSYGGL
jgi:uncharacterized protein YyaL (SSP411 family)